MVAGRVTRLPLAFAMVNGLAQRRRAENLKKFQTVGSVGQPRVHMNEGSVRHRGLQQVEITVPVLLGQTVWGHAPDNSVVHVVGLDPFKGVRELLGFLFVRCGPLSFFLSNHALGRRDG